MKILAIEKALDKAGIVQCILSLCCRWTNKKDADHTKMTLIISLWRGGYMFLCNFYLSAFL